MTTRMPKTVVEVVEARRNPEMGRFVRISHVMINGQPVMVAKDGIHVDYDHNLANTTETARGGVVAVTMTLLVDEFSIKAVPTEYPKTGGGADARMFFPRDEKGRFTKRK